MALEHLRTALTKGNLWLYILTELEEGSATPGELKTKVEKKHGFAPARITFYSVMYRLRREGLVERSSENFRSPYKITPKGKSELARALQFVEGIARRLTSSGSAPP